MLRIPFRKMHGLGNDFVVFDGRKQPLALSVDAVRHLSDRRRGIGCDQLVVMEPSPAADTFMRIYNADGSEVGACGNASRCVASLIMQESGGTESSIATRAGLLSCRRESDGRITVDMGEAKLDWQDIPLAKAMDTLSLPIAEGPLSNPVAVGMGNPHAIFFVNDTDAVDLAALGPKLEHHPLFPAQCNITIARVSEGGRLFLRVWERGVGETLACGTAACAAAVAAHRRGLAPRENTVHLPGGDLEIRWRETDGHVLMTGPVALSFEGTVEV
ncbi:MAG: diaminopimelate epimerase [Alphaproteobacteria bacterium]|nr:diaminopimelate epimerase [Alphaproteobacteria bacterium]